MVISTPLFARRCKMNRKIVGIILAGGQSRRYGTPKAFALMKGIPFYQYSINVMNPFVESIVLVSNIDIVNRFEHKAPNLKLIIDNPSYAGLGPLAGIYSGMESVKAEWYLISPIDVPFMEESVFKTLLENIEVGIEAVVPIVRGNMQPLISVFHRSMKERIKNQLMYHELSPKQLFIKSEVKFIEIEHEKPFRNINYQDDLRRYEEKDI
ncbi:molybdenum cofactor guanylyltransferase [Paucisalibacillus sp. EB02]|uniref:molybdenum cofactor guanylyltransferase n=1 Tax=Paucisalibacillus sp. EB02 TaxID=1347087 RepID=UPI0009DE7F87|nr:molybdenum cofactor guanylyltransferase [Paucisalibacillus sp. EB02]